MLAILAALPSEVGGLLRRLQGRQRTPLGDGLLYRGTVQGKELAVCITGVGPARAERTTRAFLSEHRPSAILLVGLAGGLSPELKPGTLVLSTAVSPWVWSESAGPAESAQPILCDPALLEKARALLKERRTFFITGRTACSPVLVTRRRDKEELFKLSGAQAVDMEAFWVLQAAREHNVPCLNVRSVMDTAKEDLPRSLARIAAASGRLTARDLAEFGVKVWQWPVLFRAARHRRKALRSLDASLHDFIALF